MQEVITLKCAVAVKAPPGYLALLTLCGEGERLNPSVCAVWKTKQFRRHPELHLSFDIARARTNFGQGGHYQV